MKKFFAAFFILVMVLPFTEPWPVCSLTELNRGDEARAVQPPPMGGITSFAVSKPSTAAPDAVTPITLLPPLRTETGSLRVSLTSTLDVLTVVAAMTPPTARWFGAGVPHAVSVPLTIAPALRL